MTSPIHRSTATLVCGCVSALAACNANPPDLAPDSFVDLAPCEPDQWFERRLAVETVVPEAVFVEGTDIVTLTTNVGCERDGVRVTLDGTDVAVQRTSSTTFAFAAPARPVASATVFSGVVTCATAEAGLRFTCNSAPFSITVDPKLEPALKIRQFAPQGPNVHVDDRLVVEFTRAVDPTTVTSSTFGITGGAGTLSSSADSKTWTLTPTTALSPATTYVAFATTGIRSLLTGRPLVPAIAAPGEAVAQDRDTWTFTTVAAVP